MVGLEAALNIQLHLQEALVTRPTHPLVKATTVVTLLEVRLDTVAEEVEVLEVTVLTALQPLEVTAV
jgi:hypothetical protein